MLLIFALCSIQNVNNPFSFIMGCQCVQYDSDYWGTPRDRTIWLWLLRDSQGSYHLSLYHHLLIIGWVHSSLCESWMMFGLLTIHLDSGDLQLIWCNVHMNQYVSLSLQVRTGYQSTFGGSLPVSFLTPSLRNFVLFPITYNGQSGLNFNFLLRKNK